MSETVYPWPNVAGRADAPLPRHIKRPCDYSLKAAICDLESQLGTIEAYNRLATAAAAVKAEIDAGNAKPQNPMFAVSTGAVTTKKQP